MKKFAIEIKWGVIFTIVQLLWMILEKNLGWHGEKIDQHATNTIFFAIPSFIIYIIALIDKRNNFYDGKMTWLQGFLTGLYIGIVVAVLSPLTTWLTIEVISPEYFENAIRYAVESGQSTLEEAQSYFSYGSYVLQSIFGAIIMGAITAAIVALFVKKK